MNPLHASLVDPPAESALVASVEWLEATALGNAATSVAVIAVAAIGLLMLAGRLELRRGLTVVAGCFILFGAASIGAAITGLGNVRNAPPPSNPPGPSPLASATAAADQARPAYDPYAGASVPLRQ